MANRKHREILRKGVREWNSWRRANPNVTPDLFGANLSGANLIGANLKEAKLSGVNLTAAHLVVANLTAADLVGADLTGAVADKDTQWPEGFDPVAAGVIFE